MSLHALCSECGKKCGWYHGNNFLPDSENEQENHFVIQKVSGTMGATFDSLVSINGMWICRECLKTKLPNYYKSYVEQFEKQKNKEDKK